MTLKASRAAIAAALTLVFVQIACMVVAPAAFAPVGAARAQDAAAAPAAPDYTTWDRQARQIEDLVEAGTPNSQQLQALRQQVVEWRERFLAAQNVNAPRIGTVREQIAALGPVPAEGESEAPDVAARRAELNASLSELQAPGLQAVEAASRATGIIQSIDALERERQTSELMQLSPSPLLPSSWATAARDTVTLAQGLGDEMSDRLDAASRGDWRARAPAVLGYVVAALLLLIYGWRWIAQLPSRLSARSSDYSRDAIVFLASLGQIVLPTLGVWLAVRAADLTGLFGEWGRPILIALPVAAFAFFAGRWLSDRFFPAQGLAPVKMPDEARCRAKLNADLLVAVVALHVVVSRALVPVGPSTSMDAATTVPMNFAPATSGVWHTPLVALAALLLFRLGSTLRRAVKYDGSEQPSYQVRIVALAGAVVRPVAVIVVLLALVGYNSMANGILWPLIDSLALLGLLMLLQEFIIDAYALLARDQGKGRQALAPVLIGFALVIAAIPVFALIWGARVSDLLEGWTRLRQGVSLGGIRLSPGGIVMFLVVFAIGYALTRFIQGAFRTSILPRTKIDAGGQNAIVSGLGYVGIMLASVLAITAAGIDLSSLAIVAGALSVGIGFGMQNIVSNFVSGIILLIERPIALGDWIRVGTAEGYVRRISVRSTQIQTFDRTNIIVPNSDLISQPVTNWTRGSLQGRVIVPVTVAYGSDTRKVTQILTEIAEDQPIVLINPAPSVLFTGFGADGLNFEIRAIISDVNQGMGVQTEIRHQIIDRFEREEIVIPYTHRDVTIRNVEDLTKLADPLASSSRGVPKVPAPAEAAPRATAPRSVGKGEEPDALDPRIAGASSSGLEDAPGDGDGDADGDGGGDGRG